MTNVPYETCERCGETFPLTEMRAIRETVRAGWTSGHSRSGRSNSLTSSSSGFSTSTRSSSGHVGGTTRYKKERRFYCVPKGCFQKRKRQIFVGQLFGWGFIGLLVVGGIAVYSSNRNISTPTPTSNVENGQSSLPESDGSSASSATAAPETKETPEPPPSSDARTAEAPEAAPNQSSDATALTPPSPDSYPALAAAVKEALESGQVARWHDGSGASGEVSVSAAQTYQDRECRSYRFTVRHGAEVYSSNGDTACKLTDGPWDLSAKPPG